MDLSPRGIREHLGLNRPIYARTSAYGHFGRAPDADGGFSWEKTDLAEQLRSHARVGAPWRNRRREAPTRRALYGRSKGKALRAASRAASSPTSAALEVDAARARRGAPLFDFAPRELWLEIGFGGGEHLVAQARAHPDVGFIGCEPFVNGVAKAAGGDRAQRRSTTCGCGRATRAR